MKRMDESTVLADGPGGVTWIGRAVVREDLRDEATGERFREFAERRMEGGGELCPFELLPSPDCFDELEQLLERIGIAERGNVEVYSLVS